MDTLNIINTYGAKVDNESTLVANEWNTLISTLLNKINELVSAANSSSGGSAVSTVGESHFYVNNLKVEPVDGIITLTAGDTYELQGKLNGQIVVNCGQEAPSNNTELRLNGVEIITSKDSGIKYLTPEENTGFKDLVITLEKDSVNNIVCTKVAEIADNQEACIYSMNNMVLQGVGYLTCFNKGGHGIRATELRIAGPHIYALTSHDMIHAGKIMNIERGTFMCDGCNDMFGTGAEGNIYFFDGDIYAHNPAQNIFDAKVNLYYMNAINDIASHVKYSNLSTDQYCSKPALSYTDYYTNIESQIKCYDVINDIAAGTTEPSDTFTVLSKDESTGVYIATTPFIEISGMIDAPIIFTVEMLNTMGDPDAEISLKNACIINNTKEQPTILYSANSNGDGKVKVTSEKNTINMVLNEIQTLTLNTEADADAIKSENNLSIEIKNGSHFVIHSYLQDGLDGGELKITDSKGCLLVNDCGQRGLKGNAIVIGPSCNIKKSVIQNYITDPEDEDYTTFEGTAIVINNCKKVLETALPWSGISEDKTTGFADVYCRNGKHSKGTFGTTKNELKGIIIMGTFGTAVDADFADSNNIYYAKTIFNSIKNDCGITRERYITLPYGKAPIIK